MPSRRPPERGTFEDLKDLGNQLRNEQQKSVLLCEVGKIRREEVDALIERSKQIVERSKQLCETARQRRGEK